MSIGLRIETLSIGHPTADFHCGNDALNRWLNRYALQSQQAGASRTYVGLENDHVVGFYTLAVGQIDHDDATDRLTKGLARHPVPVMLLARLAVDRNVQGRGLGGGLLKDAMLRTLQAADIAGIRALVAHAKDDAARRFYERFDFASSPTDALHMFVLLKDVRAFIGSR